MAGHAGISLEKGKFEIVALSVARWRRSRNSGGIFEIVVETVVRWRLVSGFLSGEKEDTRPGCRVGRSVTQENCLLNYLIELIY